MPKKRVNRILIKLSGESLMGKENYGIDNKTGKIDITGGGMGGWPFPAPNQEANYEGGDFGYDEP